MVDKHPADEAKAAEQPDVEADGQADGESADETPRVPSVDDIVMQQLGERWETPRELLNFPSVMSNAIPRSVLTSNDATDLLRSHMQHNLWQYNSWDPMSLAWNKQALSTAIDGRARSEAVQVATSTIGRLAETTAAQRDGPKPRR